MPVPPFSPFQPRPGRVNMDPKPKPPRPPPGKPSGELLPQEGMGTDEELETPAEREANKPKPKPYRPPPSFGPDMFKPGTLRSAIAQRKLF